MHVKLYFHSETRTDVNGVQSSFKAIAGRNRRTAILWLYFIKNAAHANTTHKTSEGGKNNAEKAKIYIDCSHYLAAYAAWHAAL